MAENFAAHVIHGLLADALHDANLDVLGEEIEREHRQVQQAQPNDARPCAGFGHLVIHRRDEIVVDSLLENGRWSELEWRDHRHKRQRQNHAPAVRLQVLQEPPHQARVVRFA